VTTTDIADLVDSQIVVPDLATGDRQAAIEALTDRLVATGRVTDGDGFVAAVLAREQETGGTGMESGIAIPHAKHPAVRQASVAVGRAPRGIDFGAADAPADLIFLIAAPDGADDVHVVVLAKLARRLVHDDFRTALRQAPDAQALAATVRGELT
jgi:fructose-specific phosphotransferase system IIA component